MSSGAASCLALLLGLAVTVGLLAGGLPALCLRLALRCCPFCRGWVLKQATKCQHCHEWLTLIVLGIVMLTVQGAAAERVAFLDCPALAFFGHACVVVEPVPVTPAAAVLPSQSAYPLFRREEMAPDTPAILLRAMQDPTDANIEAWLAWQQARQSRITYVQHRARVLRSQVRPE